MTYRRYFHRKTLSAALLLGSGQVLAQHAPQPPLQAPSQADIAQSAIAALANLAANAGSNTDLAQAAIAAIANIAVGVAVPMAAPAPAPVPMLDAPTDVDAEPEDVAAPATDAPATDAPATDAPATDAPATDAPATDASATDASATDAPATDAPDTLHAPEDAAPTDPGVIDDGDAAVELLGVPTSFDSRMLADAIAQAVMPEPVAILAALDLPVAMTPEPVAVHAVQMAEASPAEQAPTIRDPELAQLLQTLNSLRTAQDPAPSTAASIRRDNAPVPPAPNAAVASQPARSGQYTFSPNRLAFPVDIQMFTDGNPVLPGVYRLDVHLNDAWLGKFEVRFANLHPSDRIAQPCFDAQLLDTLGFDLKALAPEVQARLDAGESICGPLAELVAGATHTFNSSQQELVLTSPQAMLARRPRGFVPPSRWDGGINAATLAYSYNGYSSTQSLTGTRTSHYLGLRAGLNLGDWRLRFRGTFSKSAEGSLTYARDSLYLERAVPSLNARLVLGDSPTSGHVFDSLSIRGAQLMTETRMQPEAQTEFVPIIRGIAQSNAKVTVEQRGEQILEMTVPPGPFVLDDIAPNGRGGDLLVTVTEADGSQRRFTVTYANLPEMLRPGTLHYSAAIGQYRSRAFFDDEPVLGLFTVSYGFNNTVTGYGGVLAAEDYHAFSAGAGFNLGIGAVSADVTWANTRGLGISKKETRGYAFRLGYTKFMPEVDSEVTLAMYRYATQGYYEPAQAFTLRDEQRRQQATGSLPSITSILNADKRRHQFALRVVHQPSGDWGAATAGMSVQDYWNRPGRDLQYFLSYGRNIGRVNVSVTLNRNRNIGTQRWENQVMLNLAIPLATDKPNPTYVNSNFTRQRSGVSAQTSVSGTLGERQHVGYTVFAMADKAKGSSRYINGGGSVSITTAMAKVGASASLGSHGTRQVGLTASGGVLAFKDGVVFASDLGDTVGIVQAKHAAGAMVRHSAPTTIDARGYALVPHLQPYRENDVMLDPKGMSNDVQLAITNLRVAPTDGAVVVLNYATRQGYAVLVRGKRRDGTALPFGAGVLNAEGKNLGYVAQGGQAVIRADAPKGVMTVRWGPFPDQRCTFDYDLQKNGTLDAPDGSGFRRLEVTCN